MLDGGEDGSADWLRELNRREEVLRVKIVLARLVDHPNLAMLRRLRVRKHLINLPTLQRYLVPVVFPANSKFLGFPWFSCVRREMKFTSDRPAKPGFTNWAVLSVKIQRDGITYSMEIINR